MAVTTVTSANTLTPFSGGQLAVAPLNAVATASFMGAWNVGDNWTVIMTDALSGLQTQVGNGYATGASPTFVFAFNNKVYALGGASVYFSAIGQPTTWNDPNASGNGFITLNNWYSTPEPLVAAAPYQGRLMFFSRRTVQIWTTDANPSNWAIQQIMPNIGALAPASVQPMGDLDVFCLYDSGLRSLRVRDSSLNAYVADLGSPIDQLVQTNLLNGTADSNAAACSVVEPTSNRYWCFLNGVIYVFSFFPTNKVQAWSTYQPIDSDGKTMNITQFAVINGQVWAYGTDSTGAPAAWQYGGASNNVFDASLLEVVTPFLDTKSPKMQKQVHSLAVAANGNGGNCKASVQLAVSPITADLLNAPQTAEWITTANQVSSATFDLGKEAAAARGTHLALRVTTTGAGPFTLSMFAEEFDRSKET